MNTLNVGDQLDPLFLDPNLRPSDLPRQHKNAWDHTGFVREGWCQVGSGGKRRGDLSHTNRELDVLCSLSRTWQLLQEHALVDQYLKPALEGRLGSIYLSIYHDATPFFVRFGALAGMLQPHARYLLKMATIIRQLLPSKSTRRQRDEALPRAPAFSKSLVSSVGFTGKIRQTRRSTSAISFQPH